MSSDENYINLDFDIDKIMDSLMKVTPEKKTSMINVNGIDIPYDVFKKGIRHPSSETYRWRNAKGELDSPREEFPAIIRLDGTVEYWKDGQRHAENSPAKLNLKDKKVKEYWLHGRKVSFDEHIHYIPEEKKIIFTLDGEKHRTDGPAVIDFTNIYKGKEKEEFWEYGKMVKPKLNTHKINLKAPEMAKAHISKIPPDYINMDSIYKELNDFNKNYIESKKPIEKEFNEIMKDKKIKSGAPDLTGGRFSQIAQGGLHGFKRGAVNASTKLLAEKAIEMSPLETHEDNAAFILQLVLQTILAEAVDNIPDVIADKVNLSYEDQQEAASFLRVTCGENIGRKFVSTFADMVVPAIKDLAASFSKEEIIDFAETYEKEATKSLAPAEHRITMEEFLENSNVSGADIEEVMVEEVEVEHAK